MKKKKNNILAEGEATGHHHKAEGEGVAVYEEVYPDSLKLDAPNGAEVTHQEHNPIKIKAGKYRTGQVLEYDHFTEEAREVRD